MTSLEAPRDPREYGPEHHRRTTARGQSVTAAGLLGSVAAQAVPASYATVLHAFGLVYGIPVGVLAAVWAGVAVLLYAVLLAAWVTVASRTARASLRGGIFLAPAPAPVTRRT